MWRGMHGTASHACKSCSTFLESWVGMGCALSAGGAAGCRHLRAVSAAHAGPGGPRHPLICFGAALRPLKSARHPTTSSPAQLALAQCVSVLSPPRKWTAGCPFALVSCSPSFAVLHSDCTLVCRCHRAGPRCMWRTTWALCPSASCCRTPMTPSSGGAPARTGSSSRWA